MRPESWLQFRRLLLLEPGEGDVLPLRAEYEPGGAYGIGLNEIASSPRPLWFLCPDAIASRLLSPTAKTPRILRSLRFEPRGQAAGLKEMRFGGVTIDLRKDNLYKTLIEERKLLATKPDLSAEEQERLNVFFKLVANSLFGITAETNRRELPKNTTEAVEVHGLTSFESQTHAPDEDGTWPTTPVRNLIERIASPELEEGFRIEIYNSRGTTSRGLLAGGAQERELVTRYEDLAARIRDGWPRTAAILSELARGYEREARRHDEETERFRQGMER